ncbi:hypothetical protein LT330_004609 [Penicillium expansum]|uniref:Uncharacterized protein n=1 Tax=Penicillium expansum TaxID=27334 RepID=A0A0A2IDH7_PENEN|nr:hypothetical protein PEX2_014960 [Penicillium expansum]KAK4860878.1 hypothetical protein LT330_004609 [Penicillium expansum]KGO40420.1 hypothetical protein PEX1_075890 [Penicillium expansum]KGO41127.1 hypothetical protein PEXP_084900 [Penicillium expansum]KGO62000.1 hypothetical protein PEX2_014960 [Penicillium expansum]
MALRHILRYSNDFALADGSLGKVFRELIQFFIDSTEETPVVHEGFIRCFTFDALDLKHACCIETRRNFGDPIKLESREEEEIEEIIDEQKLRLIDFEKLVIEFQAKFDELALPMMEFLEGHWYNRMIDFLRQRDRYNEEHFIGSRRIGVNLLQEEEFPPNGILRLIGSFHKVVDIEESPRIE